MIAELQISIAKSVLMLKHNADHDEKTHGNRGVPDLKLDVWQTMREGDRWIPRKIQIQINPEKEGYSLDVWKNQQKRSWVVSLKYRGDEIASHYVSTKNQAKRFGFDSFSHTIAEHYSDKSS